MNVQTLALILIAVTISAAAQILFKLGLVSSAPANSPHGGTSGLLAALLTPGVLIGLALYGVGTLVWLTALSRVEVSQAYPFVGLGFVLTAIFGYFLFDDHITLQRLGGIFLVIAGIVVIARS
ncbi:MAG: EamA family transporter [Proteobacteria bacterium]|nr:EamA family transporter [Pseudomonadota bacterium]